MTTKERYINKAKNNNILSSVKYSYKINYKFGYLSKEGYRHFPVMYIALGNNGFSLFILGVIITAKLW